MYGRPISGTPDGRRIADLANSNLHVLNYSAPVRARLELAELKKHVFTLPEQPDLVPYRTSYYAERWGFCMSHNQLMQLREGTYEVVIDASLEPGSLTYGEFLHRGRTADEFLLSAHICHPSLANDNCSGLAVLTHLAERISTLSTHYSYRFLFAPGTIGAITWLAKNEDHVSRIKHGLVVSCVGDGGGPTYKRSRRGVATIDRIMAHVLQHAEGSARILDFSPYGYDERQYCSPGFNLPVGLFQRSQHGTFPQYHTSADNLDFIRPEHLAASYGMIAQAIEIAETDRIFPQHPAERRAAAGTTRSLRVDRRSQRRAGDVDGAPLGAQLFRRREFAARHRRTLRNALSTGFARPRISCARRAC